MNTYAALANHWKKVEVLRSTQNLLQWDMETYMPPGSIATREEQLALTGSLEHQWLNDSQFKENVFRVEGQTPREKRNLELWRRSVLVSSAVDGAWVEAFSRTSSKCNMLWRLARQKADYSLVQETFQNLINLVREQFQKIAGSPGLAEKYKGWSLYAVAFDQYEPSFPLAQMERMLVNLCDQTRKMLPEIIRAKNTASTKTDDSGIAGILNKNFCESIMKSFGFDFATGRLDLSAHPFCGGAVGDVRLTTRINPADPVEDLFSTLHELGHALYEQGLPELTQFEPSGKACSYGVHESQSRFLENFIGRSRGFCKFLSVKTGMSEDTLFAKLNPVKLDYIRVDADEVTYNLHILLRLQLERDILEGRLEAKDLPEAWNSKLQAFTGLPPPPIDKGCLQDTHWYSGSFGYFPTYSLGNMLAAELFSDFKIEFPDWESKVANGNFKFIRDFMDRKVYRLASQQDSPATIENIIGRKLSETTLLHYFTEKFG